LKQDYYHKDFDKLKQIKQQNKENVFIKIIELKVNNQTELEIFTDNQKKMNQKLNESMQSLNMK
jgi:hypothetical protein